jgi:hypothetical protein
MLGLGNSSIFVKGTGYMRHIALLTVAALIAGCSSNSMLAGPPGAGAPAGPMQAPNRELRGASGFYVVPDIPGSGGSGQVTLYPGSLYAPSQILYSFGSQQGSKLALATDPSQNLYVANDYYTHVVDEYAPLTNVPKEEWACQNYPSGLAVENNLIYAMEERAGDSTVSVEVFQHGSSAPVAQYQVPDLSGSGAIAVDASGDVFVTGGGGVFELSHGDSSFHRVFGNIYEPNGIAVDSSGNLVLQYVGRHHITHTEIYPPGSSTPIKSFRHVAPFSQLSFTHDGGRVYAPAAALYGSGFTFYHYPSFKPIYSYAGPGWFGVLGIAASPPGAVGTW